MKLKNSLLLVISSLIGVGSSGYAMMKAPTEVVSVQEFNQALDFKLYRSADELVPEKTCRLYLVHHGDTEWTQEDRLQGWTDIPLNQAGKEQAVALAEFLADVKAAMIYFSPLKRAAETAEVIAVKHPEISLVPENDLRGESHGALEGKTAEEYRQDPHYKKYKSLPMEERFFFSVGEGGLSKAEVVSKVIPLLKKICQEHPGEEVIIVTHGGVLKGLNFLLEKSSSENFLEVPHGDVLEIQGDGQGFFRVN